MAERHDVIRCGVHHTGQGQVYSIEYSIAPCEICHLQGSGTLLDRALLSLTIPGAPFLVHAQSSNDSSLVVSDLTDSSRAAYVGLSIVSQGSPKEVIEEAWR